MDKIEEKLLRRERHDSSVGELEDELFDLKDPLTTLRRTIMLQRDNMVALSSSADQTVPPESRKYYQTLASTSNEQWIL